MQHQKTHQIKDCTGCCIYFILLLLLANNKHMGLDVPRPVVIVFTVNLAIMWMVLVFMAAEKAGRDVNVQQVSEN